jgi:hypothetical protein
VSVDTGTLFETEQSDLERRIRLVVAEMHKQPGWPVDDAKDRALARELIEQFPRMDLPAQILAWRQWMAEFQPKPGKKVNMRARIVTWCARERGRGRGAAVRRVRAANGRADTTPRSAADFEQFDSWL